MEKMEKVVDIISREVLTLNEDSKQEWISVKDFIPDWSGGKGSYHGSYLCITERLDEPGGFDYKEGNVSKNVEICYYNNLARRFQDKDREWIKVTHWTQIPEKPLHNSKTISREEMLKRIEEGEFKVVYHKNADEELHSFGTRFALTGISFDDETFFSVNINESIKEEQLEEEVENYMYCVLTDIYKNAYKYFPVEFTTYKGVPIDIYYDRREKYIADEKILASGKEKPMEN